MSTARPNKAHTATVNRLVERLGGRLNSSGDIVAVDGADGEMTIAVATSATVAESVARLANRPGMNYVAMTNREGVRDAVRAAEGTRVGVMRPDGAIVRAASG